ncbi:hypothetical protein JXL19_10645 [bacterium]|nr:hypothetical protein [bacterium]
MGIGDKIKKIKEAEDAFEKMLQDARMESERLIDQAHKDARQSLQREIDAAERESEEIMSLAEKEIQNKINQIELQVSDDIKGMQSLMGKKRDQAIKMIQEKVVGLDVD